MTTQQVLLLARDRIRTPYTWTQEAQARTTSGMKCGMRDPFAVRWSADAALELASDTSNEGMLAQRALRRQMGRGKKTLLMWFNDNHNHDQVLALFDRAIAAEAIKGEQLCLSV